MAVNVEYIIKLRDKFSNKIKKADNQADKLNKKVRNINSSFSGIGSTIASLGIGLAIGAAAKSVITLGLEMEQTRVSFATFLGTAEKGNAMLDKLNKFANVTPFDNAQVIAASKTLLAFGVTAEEMEPTLKILGDVAAGTGKDLSEFGRIFGKMKGNGRLMGDELNMLVDAGFNPLQQMSERTGESMLSLKKKMEKGQISFHMIQNEFKIATSEGGRFANMMEKQSKTVGGRISTLLGQLQLLGIKIGEAINPALGVLVDFGSAILKNGEALKTLAVVVGIAATAFGIYKIITFALTASQWSLNAAMAANPIGAAVVAIAALIAMVAVVIRHYDNWGAALSFLLGPLGLVIALVQTFRRNWDSIKKTFTEGGILEGLKRIGIVLVDALLMPLQQLLEIASKIPGIGNLAARGAAKILRIREGLALNTTTNASGASLTDAGGEKSLVDGGANGTGAAIPQGVDAGVAGITSAAPKTFNINIEKLVDGLSINTTNITETATRIKEEVEKALLTAVTDVSIISE